MTSLPARVAAIAEATPASIALVDGAQRLCYRTFMDRSAGFAAALRTAGTRAGDRVAIILPNRVEAAVAVYGCWLAGAIAVPLNPQARRRDLDACLRHCEARHVVHEAGNAEVVATLSGLEAPPVAWLLDAETSLPCPPHAAPDIAIDPATAAMILYTSGTTGAPKGVTLSHANLLANAQAVVGYLDLAPGDSALGVLPFHYAYGASVLHTHLLAGARLVIAPNLLFPHLLMETVVRERITGLSGVPSTFALLLDRVALADYDLSSLRYVTQAGSAMTAQLLRRLRSALPSARLFVMYGQTEATSRLTWLPPEQLDAKPGSVGLPIDGVRLRIVREDGTEAPAGTEGEVQAQGPGVMLGYWGAPEASAAVLRGGWLCTGDVGWLDHDGYLYLAGRRGDMIKTGAHRVHPADVEEAISELPGVGECAVVGIDDPILGQVVKAFVVLDPPPLADAVARIALSIKAHCRARLAPHKIPREIEFMDALPRTASGKLRRTALAATGAIAA